MQHHPQTRIAQALRKIGAALERLELAKLEREKQDAERALLLSDMQEFILEQSQVVATFDNGGNP